MRFLIAPDKFKGTLRAIEVAGAIELGIKKALPDAEAVLLPLADGGEGTVEAIVKATEGKIVSCPATGPLREKVNAYFGLFPSPDLPGRERAVIEMAAASGLHLVPKNKLNPLLTTTYGTGELIKAALDQGVTEIVVGIGDSATVDGGLGMAQALGVRFLDENGRDLGPGGQELRKLERLDVTGRDRRISGARILVASDVTNPLIGSDGAAYVYGPQKGATPAMVEVLEEGLKKYAEVILDQLGKDVGGLAGAGAAGGLGAGLVAFLDAEIVSGIEYIMQISRLEEKLEGVDAVITGEGQIDSQTFYGKAPMGIAELARKRDIPVYAICGRTGDGADEVREHGISKILALSDIAPSLDDARHHAAKYIEIAAEKLAAELRTPSP
jgi:glycerate kinase